ncbi:uncharacterized protein HMPREF1541_07911 [Cyphellophora europaea CBS 101466]|uniref:Serine aminopeptidase S33 domain-containing protein n=1 Tax=Cyphellophora europaea (strain CBS 101466) TaxID=1220924 RepID=W2RMI3_CYPE1|nr:uncharacterized protein HMPREF1541_07911 [Cyphellophora europaea CBS 101466]ETN36924.1 hypothetical protein HMPREF1541_07911 [Cyphellophora europaea CBS 101466]
MPTTVEGSFKTADGVDLYTKTWKPDGAPVGVIIFIHGFSDHCNTYDTLFKTLSAPPYSLQVNAFDQRGWGRSVRQPSQRGATGPTSAVLADLHAFVLHTISQLPSPPPPLFMMGASMGGAIALHYTLYTLRSTTIRNRPQLAGLILSAPFVALDHRSAPSWVTVKAGKLAAKAFPNQQRVNKLEAKYMCRDPQVCSDWVADPLCHDTGTLGGLSGMLQRAADLVSLSQGAYVRSLTNELPCPIWVAHGEADRVTSCKATQRLYDVLSAPEGDRTMRAFPGAYHMLHKEPDGTGQDFTREVAEWCVRRCRGERGALPPEARKSMHVSRSRDDALRKSVDANRVVGASTSGNGNGNGHVKKQSNGGTKL